MKWIRVFDSIDKAREFIPSQTSRLVKIGDRRVCLLNHNGEFYALNDRCPHMGASLSQGTINYLGEVICPLHEYRYDHNTGYEANNKCENAMVLKVKVEDSGVFLLV